MRKRLIFSVLTLATTISASARDNPVALLKSQIEDEAKKFCRSVHGTNGSLLPSAIKSAANSNAKHPDMIVNYRGIQCSGVENAPLLQGGFCGLTMDGMKCQVKVFKYRAGKYVEAGSYLK